MLGGLFGYLIGHYAFDLVEPWLRTSHYWSAYEQAVAWFEHWGFWAIFVAGFSPIPYKVFTIAAGAVDVLLCSPYLRAVETARRLLQVGEMPTTLRVDERLREKEFGVLDRYTRYGIQQKFPDLFEQRAHVGKFYFRPPGGESWCDVILRLRSFMEMTAREYDGQRVLVVGHQVIVSCLRYLLEGLAEQEILAIDREGDVPNCGVTSYHFHAEGFRDGRLVPRLVNFTAPLEQAGTPVTAAKDVPAAPKA